MGKVTQSYTELDKTCGDAGLREMSRSSGRGSTFAGGSPCRRPNQRSGEPPSVAPTLPPRLMLAALSPPGAMIGSCSAWAADAAAASETCLRSPARRLLRSPPLSSNAMALARGRVAELIRLCAVRPAAVPCATAVRPLLDPSCRELKTACSGALTA